MYFRIEQQYQSVLTLWHESHINMKSIVSWHYLVNEIDRIRASNVASVSEDVYVDLMCPQTPCHIQGEAYTSSGLGGSPVRPLCHSASAR